MAERNNNGRLEWAPPINQMSREDLNNNECSICLNPLYVASDDIPVPDPTEINNCHHRFHRQCLVASCGANLANCRCPTCQENFNCGDAGLTDLTPQVEARFAVLNAPPPELEPAPAAVAAPQIDVHELIERVNQLARACYQEAAVARNAERRQSGEQARQIWAVSGAASKLSVPTRNLIYARTVLETRTLSLKVFQEAQKVSSSANNVLNGRNFNITPQQRESLEASRDTALEIQTLVGQIIMSTMPQLHEPEIDIAPIQQVIITDPEIRRISEQLVTFINSNTASKRQEILQILGANPQRGINDPPPLRSRDGTITADYILQLISYYVRQSLLNKYDYETLQPPAEYTTQATSMIMNTLKNYESNNPQTTIDSLEDIMRDGLGARYQEAQERDRNSGPPPQFGFTGMDYNANVKRFLSSLQIKGSSLPNFFNQMYRLMLENYGGNMHVNNQGAVAMRRGPQQPRTLRDYFQLILDLFTRIQYLINENQFHGGKKERKSKRKTRRNRRKTRKNKRTTRRNRK
jgi:hypothetical protein